MPKPTKKFKALINVSPISSKRTALIKNPLMLDKFKKINDQTISEKQTFISEHISNLNKVKYEMTLVDKTKFTDLLNLFNNFTTNKKIEGANKVIVKQKNSLQDSDLRLRLVTERKYLEKIKPILEDYNQYVKIKKRLTENFLLRRELSSTIVLNRRNNNQLRFYLNRLNSKKISDLISKIANNSKNRLLSIEQLTDLILEHGDNIKNSYHLSDPKLLLEIEISPLFSISIFSKVKALKKQGKSNSVIITQLLTSIKDMYADKIKVISQKIKLEESNLKSKIHKIDLYSSQNTTIGGINDFLLNVKKNYPNIEKETNVDQRLNQIENNLNSIVNTESNVKFGNPVIPKISDSEMYTQGRQNAIVYSKIERELFNLSKKYGFYKN